MMKTAHLGEAGPHPVIASAARELLNKSDNERSGVLSTAMSFLGFIAIPSGRGHPPLRLAHRRYGRRQAIRPRSTRGPAIRHQPGTKP